MEKNKNKIFISGFFNTLHPGHIRLLKFAKNLGDELVVGVISKKIISNKSYNSDKSRIETLKSINFIIRKFNIFYLSLRFLNNHEKNPQCF